jgi:hypothetical protein
MAALLGCEILPSLMIEKPTTPDLRPLVQRVAGVKRSEVEELMSFFAPDSVWDISRVG